MINSATDEVFRVEVLLLELVAEVKQGGLLVLNHAKLEFLLWIQFTVFLFEHQSADTVFNPLRPLVKRLFQVFYLLIQNLLINFHDRWTVLLVI